MSKLKSAILGTLALAATLGVASAQSVMPEGRAYLFRSKAQAGCPVLDWDIAVRANNTLSETIAWDDMKSIAYATGSYNPANRTFKLSAQEMRGRGRTATIDGQIRQDGWLVANIHGANLTCLNINVPWFTGD